MRCMACGAEMRLMSAVPDETLMVPGYEHHTLQCMGCNDIERRLDDRFHEIGGHGTGLLLGDSSFAVG